MKNRQGCLASLLELFLLDKLFNWLERRFGLGRGCSCSGIDRELKTGSAMHAGWTSVSAFDSASAGMGGPVQIFEPREHSPGGPTGEISIGSARRVARPLLRCSSVADEASTNFKPKWTRLMSATARSISPSMTTPVSSTWSSRSSKVTRSDSSSALCMGHTLRPARLALPSAYR